MIKRYTSFIIVLASILFFVGCAKEKTSSEIENNINKPEIIEKPAAILKNYEVVLIGEDKSVFEDGLNFKILRGIISNNKTENYNFTYLSVDKKTEEDYLEKIDVSSKAKCKVIISKGEVFKSVVIKNQNLYKDIKFIILNDNKKPLVGDINLDENSLLLYYDEKEIGYIAGYLAVYMDFQNIGFFGNNSLANSDSLGFGFVQGFDNAALEKNLTKGEIFIKYTNITDESKNQEIKAKAINWFNNGIGLILAYGYEIGNSISMQGIEDDKGIFIYNPNTLELTFDEKLSVYFDLENDINKILKNIFDGTFEGGKIQILNTKSNSIVLNFYDEKIGFAEELKNSIVERLSTGKIKVLGKEVGDTPLSLNQKVVYLEYVK